jgi:hypothetical protein
MISKENEIMNEIQILKEHQIKKKKPIYNNPKF